MAQAPLLTLIFPGSFGAYRKDGQIWLETLTGVALTTHTRFDRLFCARLPTFKQALLRTSILLECLPRPSNPFLCLGLAHIIRSRIYI